MHNIESILKLEELDASRETNGNSKIYSHIAHYLRIFRNKTIGNVLIHLAQASEMSYLLKNHKTYDYSGNIRP